MAQHILNPAKALRTLRKTPVMLRAVLSDITQAKAATLRDGPDGWSVLYIVCHLRDYEQIVLQRAHMILKQTHPILPIMDNAALVDLHQYAEQDVHTALADLAHCRLEFLHLLEGLSTAQWQRTGVHPEQGQGTMLDVAINVGLHDVDHIEQLIRCVTSVP